MSDEQVDAQKGGRLTHEALIGSQLEGMVEAIEGYDAIIWKIRTGYVTILYGALTLLVGSESGLEGFTRDFQHAVSIFLLIVGFSATAFIIDFSYLRKKLRVIVARDVLMDIALQAQAVDEAMLKILLHIAGETFVPLLPAKAQWDYTAKRNWNLKWILGPLYTTTPLIAAIIYLISLAS